MTTSTTGSTSVDIPTPETVPALPAGSWLAGVSERLQRQWPSIDAQRLDDLALDLGRDAGLRALPPAQAAETWLEPVLVPSPGSAQTGTGRGLP